jgi:heptose I phosphotransferase
MGKRCQHEATATELLRENGLLDVSQVFLRDDVEMIKSQAKGRHVVRLTLTNGRGCYIKRYPNIGFWAALCARLLRNGYSSDAMREWLALRRTQSLGVPVIAPLVVGEQRKWGLVRRAYVVTLDGERDSTLEAVALHTSHDLRATASHVAALIARLHEGGVNHRDFYIGHLLMDSSDRTGETICLMDFNRADIRTVVGLRWRVKDLAALHFSLPLRRMCVAGRLRFLLEYAGGDTALVRDLARKIHERVERTTRHVKNMLARGEANVHINS